MRTSIATGIATLLFAGAAYAQAPAPQKLIEKEAPPAVKIANVDLGAEFPEMKGSTFEQLLVTVPPGTGRMMHPHAGLPEISRVISGTLTEQRAGGEKKVYGPGSTFVNAGGIQHMWANFGTETVVMINTVIRAPAPTPAK